MQWAVSVFEVALSVIIAPYIAWVTSSIFSMRQEVALLKANVEQNKELFELLKERLK